jgi:hypothetical protein
MVLFNDCNHGHDCQGVNNQSLFYTMIDNHTITINFVGPLKPDQVSVNGITVGDVIVLETGDRVPDAVLNGSDVMNRV